MTSFCPALSFTTKHACNSSIDHGGGKRRAADLGLQPVANDAGTLFRFERHLRENHSFQLPWN